ncbi:glycosyltransferase family 2 protein [Paenibacillus pinistramenti]|uniref:glycosyltransferase family 2 protein n=1 Tax=Paenibacillus pinistramenti TaxID=1768003 RepID=UPI001107CA0A|nr:glycosyltransferase family 2 protein [Paenibacillus pinistramenti]
MTYTRLSVVIPVYNSQDSISTVVNQLLIQYKYGYNLEIILVNDGSLDRSAEICSTLELQNPNVTFMDLKRNFGQQVAIFKGLSVAAGDIIALMDDDMQTPPEELIKLLNKMNDGYDVVIGQRNEYNHTLFRRLISKYNAVVVNWLLDRQEAIHFSSFMVMKREIAKEIVSQAGANINIPASIIQITDNITNTSFNHRKRQFGKSNYNFIKLFRVWVQAMFIIIKKAKRSRLLLLLLLLACIAAGTIYLFVLLGDILARL